MSNHNAPLITLDGPSATGKSSVAWEVSKRLSLKFLNSGSLYRIAAYYVYSKKFHVDEIEKITDQINKDNISFEINTSSDSYSIQLNGVDICDKISNDHIALIASKLSKDELLRRALVKKQHDFYQLPGLVADGRDMGSCIFPEATFKFFLTASATIRAERRHKELQNRKIHANFTEVLESLVKRDEQDATRSIAPLVIPPKAIVIDTSQMTMTGVVEKVLDHCCINERC
ncbi:MAG: (d)CMP kinase [Gammaproteobacteria bacterium]|nr:(d)CMP kinase [Gammaproteobacteria bacterium]